MRNSTLPPLNDAPEPEKELARVILRDEQTKGDSRYLSASYSINGDLKIEGQDLGRAVKGVFGCSEYEWAWTIARPNLPKLAEALDAKSNLLGALKGRFSGPAAANLATFLEENEIPYESWSRVGD